MPEKPDNAADPDPARSRDRAGACDDAGGPCPVCSGWAKRAQDAYPFCSPRCRLIDLGKWLREDYRISRPAHERDLDEGA